MKKRSYIVGGILLSMLIMTSACSKEQSKSAGDDLESLDIENTTHVQLSLTDQVEVDADMTPYEDYKNGISAYYLEAYKNEADSEEESGDEIETELRLYILSEPIPQTEDQTEEETESETGQAYEDESTDFLSTGLGSLCYPDDDTLSVWRSALVRALRYTKKVSDCLLEDAKSDVQENYEEGRSLIEELTGKELSDYGICLPLDDDISYAFYYFYELNGLPILSDFLPFAEEDGGSMYNHCFGYGRVYYEADTMIGVDVDVNVSVGEVYRDSQEVIDAKEALTIAQEYYETIELTHSITISDIRLVYNTYYIDGENGETEGVILPFWYLSYFDASADCANQVLVIQAYTGEVLGSTNFIYDVDE